MFGESILWWLKNNRSAVHSIRANVLTKEMNGHKYYICFGLEEWTDEEISCRLYAYISLKEGEEGILMYQGNRFIEYDRGGE